MARGSDLLAGDRKKIYRATIQGKKIDKMLAPPDLSTKDMEGLNDTTMDVTSLPGMLSLDPNADSINDEAAQNTEFAATLLTTTMGKKSRACISDTMWRVTRQHGLQVIKSQETLFKYIQDIEECEVEALERQEDSL